MQFLRFSLVETHTLHLVISSAEIIRKKNIKCTGAYSPAPDGIHTVIHVTTCFQAAVSVKDRSDCPFIKHNTVLQDLFGPQISYSVTINCTQ